MRLTDGELRGRTIIGSDGVAIGEITALYVDNWRVDALQVTLRKEIADQVGADRSFFRAGAVEIPIRMVQSVGDAVILSIAMGDLRRLLPGASSDSPQP